jgi:hypothetical protein
LLEGLSSLTILPGRVTNAQTVGASTDDVSTLPTLGRMVWAVGFTIDALPSGMVRTNWRF